MKCPQCGAEDWTTVDLCPGCIRKTTGPVTMRMHECQEHAARLEETLARYQRKLGAARAALREAIAIVEGKPDRSPWVAVEDWKKAIEFDGRE